MPNNRERQGFANQVDRWWEQFLDDPLNRGFREGDVVVVGAGAGGNLIKIKPQFVHKPEIHGEDLFNLLLRNFKEIYDTDFTIAGGAVRDLYMKDTEGTSDVDIFIPMKFDAFMERFPELGWADKPYLIPVQPYNKGRDWDNSKRYQYKFKGNTLDLVFIEKPLTHAMVQTFPIHAQRCVYTLEGGMSISPEALVDLTNKKFTISPTITDKDYIKNLLGKIVQWKKRAVYKDFKCVQPKGKEWWMKVNSDHNTKGKVK